MARRDVLVVAVSAGLAVILVFLLFAPPRRSAAPPSRSPSPTIQSMRHTNAAAGYSFLRPSGWEVEDRGTVSELTGPNGDVVVSFGLGPEGSIEEASAGFVGSIEGEYEDVRSHEPQRQRIGARPTIVVGGTAVNEAGVDLRFLAITVRMEGENYAISVFVVEGSDPVRVLPSVEDIIGSLDVV